MSKPIIGVTTSFEDKEHLEKQIVSEFYPEGVRKAGGEPKKLDFLTPLERIPSILEGLDGVLLIGGGDYEPSLYGEERNPKCGPSCLVKDQYEIELTRQAAKAGVPILGICRGLQTVNVAFGGSLVQDVPSVTGKLHQQPKGNVFWHDVYIVPNTILSSLTGAPVIATNSYHHQSAKRIGNGLIVSSRARDGIVEALESTGERSWILALQWHPERTVGKDRYSLRFFEALVQRAEERQGNIR